MLEFINSAALLMVLLNPFLVIVYLTDVIETLDRKAFRLVMVRAGLISLAVFCAFALLGEAIFSYLVHADFASFQIFGGIVFLLIGLQFVFKGNTAIEILRGESRHLAGAIAMPVIIGPGTISASIISGRQHSPPIALLAIFLGLVISIGLMVGLKAIHDYVRPRRENLVQRYIEIAGRITALVVGTISVEMIMRGLKSWLEN